MKDLIKIVIALVFIISAYYLGSHIEDEKHNLQTEQLNNKLSLDSIRIIQLQDSIHRLQDDVKKIELHHATDTVKTYTKSSH